MTVLGAHGLPGAEQRPDAAPTVLESLANMAATDPDAPAVCSYNGDGQQTGACTYRQLDRAVRAQANTLRQWVAAGDAIILQTPNSIDFVAWFLGGLRAGLRVSAVHPSATPFEVGRVAKGTGARLVIGPHPISPLTHVCVSGLPGSAGVSEVVAPPPSRGGVVLTSSGTSGVPRLVHRTEQSLDADAHGLADAAGLSPRDRVLIVVPLSHSYGVDLLVSTLLSGASLHVFEKFELPGVLSFLQRGEATVFPGVPFMFESLARSAPREPSGGLRLALSAGSPLPERVYNDCLAAWGVRVGQLYGATELGTITLNRPDRPDFDPRSVGFPVRGASVRVVSVDDPGRVLPAGEQGELAVMAPSMLSGYEDGPATLADRHFLTGDLGCIDAVGRVHVTGRLKQLIDVGGMKVNPLEVEQVFADHPGIAECALAPLRLSDTVVRLRLVFVPRPGVSVSSEDLRAFARERLSPHKLPRVFERSTALPRSVTGKLQRHMLDPA